MFSRIKYTDSYETCILHLFGGIDPAMTSHELQGLNVVIRLKKLVCSTHLWPRLQVNTGRNYFITNDYIELTVEKDEKEVDDIFNRNDDENSSSDSMIGDVPELAEDQELLTLCSDDGLNFKLYVRF